MCSLGRLVGHESRRSGASVLQGERPERDEVVKFSPGLTLVELGLLNQSATIQSWQLSVSAAWPLPSDGVKSWLGAYGSGSKSTK